MVHGLFNWNLYNQSGLIQKCGENTVPVMGMWAGFNGWMPNLEAGKLDEGSIMEQIFLVGHESRDWIQES